VVANGTRRLVDKFFMVCDPVVTPSVSEMWSAHVATTVEATSGIEIREN